MLVVASVAELGKQVNREDTVLEMPCANSSCKKSKKLSWALALFWYYNIIHPTLKNLEITYDCSNKYSEKLFSISNTLLDH